MGKKKRKKAKKRFYTSLERRMLTEKFEKPIFISTYQGIFTLKTVMQITTYDIHAEDAKDLPVLIEKPECMFAFPMEKLDVVKSGITRLTSLAKQNLQSESFLYDRKFLRQNRLPLDVELRVAMRNGLILTGRIVKHDKYHFLMRVNEKVVLVWKHGVHKIES